MCHRIHPVGSTFTDKVVAEIWPDRSPPPLRLLEKATCRPETQPPVGARAPAETGCDRPRLSRKRTLDGEYGRVYVESTFGSRQRKDAHGHQEAVKLHNRVPQGVTPHPVLADRSVMQLTDHVRVLGLLSQAARDAVGWLSRRAPGRGQCLSYHQRRR